MFYTKKKKNRYQIFTIIKKEKDEITFIIILIGCSTPTEIEGHAEVVII